jgi:putative oxidoreductase
VEDQLNTALLVVRVTFGVGLAVHGYNKVFGGGGLAGTAGWFESIGMRWPPLQARVAAAMEITAGLLFAAGLLTPLAAAGMIGLMTVAFWAVHRGKGFLIINGGWEFVAAIAIVAWAVATIGPGEFSLDHAFDIEWSGWTGSLVAGLLGVASGAAQLALSYRPEPAPSQP